MRIMEAKTLFTKLLLVAVISLIVVALCFFAYDRYDSAQHTRARIAFMNEVMSDHANAVIPVLTIEQRNMRYRDVLDLCDMSIAKLSILHDRVTNTKGFVPVYNNVLSEYVQAGQEAIKKKSELYLNLVILLGAWEDLVKAQTDYNAERAIDAAKNVLQTVGDHEYQYGKWLAAEDVIYQVKGIQLDSRAVKANTSSLDAIREDTLFLLAYDIIKTAVSPIN